MLDENNPSSPLMHMQVSSSGVSGNTSIIKTGSTEAILALLYGLAWNKIYGPLRLRRKKTASNYSEELMSAGYTNSAAACWAIKIYKKAIAGGGLGSSTPFSKYHTFLHISQSQDIQCLQQQDILIKASCSTNHGLMHTKNCFKESGKARLDYCKTSGQ